MRLLYLTSIVKTEDSKCGYLYESENFGGKVLGITEGGYFSNLEDTVFDSEYLWNHTKSIKLESDCIVSTCNKPYFDGDCTKVRKNLTSISGNLLPVKSANCTCPKICECEDVVMRRSSCARAYISQSCDFCNSNYFDLKNSTYFPEDFRNKIVSLLVKDGCSLSVFEEEDFNGDCTTYDGPKIEREWRGTIGSYECECNEQVTTPVSKPQSRPSESPELITIPGHKAEILRLFKSEYRNHPGLVAALKSLKGKRSPRNAYILLLGLTGSGKSSAINLLFDNPNLTRVGRFESTTKDIHEIRMKVPVDVLGMGNSELRVIDTPGMGDTEGIEEDAKFLATLENFLDNHEELSNRIPNIVLIFSKFSDNRFAGEGSAFTKMLRGFDAFREKITDSNYSNVVFVLSHFMSETRSLTRQPGEVLQKYKNVIKDYSLFPKPISIVVAENKPEEYNLLMVNGYYKLPNKEFYPRNLFDAIQTATSNGNDPIGSAVIQKAFSQEELQNITYISFPRVSSESNTKVFKYISLLTRAQFVIVDTEISQLLRNASLSMDDQLHRKFPEALPYLQRYFNVRNIISLKEIPQTKWEIVKIFREVNQNDANMYLLKAALNLVPPPFDENVLTGYGYNVLKDKPVKESPFNLNNFKKSDLGYQIPTTLMCNLDKHSKYFLSVFRNKAQYWKYLLEELKVEESISVSNFEGSVKSGFNIVADGKVVGNNFISAVKEYRTFELTLNENAKPSSEFESAVKRLSKYNESDYENVELWVKFFQTYGTHVVQSAYGGGSIELKLYANDTIDPVLTNKIIKYLDLDEMDKIENDESNLLNIDDIQLYSLNFRGGDSKYHISNFNRYKFSEASEIFENWKASLQINPIMLYTEVKLIPISRIAKQIARNISTEIENAHQALFNSSLKYKPKVIEIPPPDRQNTEANFKNQNDELNKLIDMLMQQMKSSESKYEQLISQHKETILRERESQQDMSKKIEEQIAIAVEPLKGIIDTQRQFIETLQTQNQSPHPQDLPEKQIPEESNHHDHSRIEEQITNAIRPLQDIIDNQRQTLENLQSQNQRFIATPTPIVSYSSNPEPIPIPVIPPQISEQPKPQNSYPREISQPQRVPRPSPSCKGIVIANALNIRTEPTALSKSVGFLYGEDIVDISSRVYGQVVNENPFWYQIPTGYVSAFWIKIAQNGGLAWCSSGEASGCSTCCRGKVTASFLNIRLGPSATNRKAGVLPKDKIVNIDSKIGNWFKISSGYVSGSYIQIIQNGGNTWCRS